MDTFSFAHIAFTRASAAQILDQSHPTTFVVPVNAQVIKLLNERPALLAAANQRFKMVVDGQIVMWGINRRAAREGLRMEKISGSEFIYTCCAHARTHGRSVALIGGLPESNEGAVARLQRDYGIRVHGYSPPMGGYPFEAAWLREIESFVARVRPDYIFLGLGAPKQELLMLEAAEMFQRLGCRLVVAAGGTFDFVSGLRRRAPPWVSRVGLEGPYRLFQEPKFFRLKRLWESVLALKYFRH